MHKKRAYEEVNAKSDVLVIDMGATKCRGNSFVCLSAILSSYPDSYLNYNFDNSKSYLN